jgi:hypothetical protein
MRVACACRQASYKGLCSYLASLEGGTGRFFSAKESQRKLVRPWQASCARIHTASLLHRLYATRTLA